LSRVEEIALPDGRRVQLWTGPATAAPAVLVCHGTPDTRWIARTGASAAASAGLRLVCVNRPGYGTSTPTDSTMTSVADDAVAVLDLLDVDRVGVVGMSVGGAYAAALAARHPDRVAAVALVAAPRETCTAMGALQAEMERARPEFAQWAAGVNAADPDDAALAARWLGSQPPDDAALLSAGLSTADIAASVREALACHDGYLRDAALLFSDWGFALSDIRSPTHLWYGAQDDRNPPATGHWWADRVAGAELTVTPTTHLATLLANWQPILSSLHDQLT
jgi:pimeloyl-ACP methyl ester carboxylesterase